MAKLLDQGADPNAHPGFDDFGTPLAWAARCNHPRTAAALIRRGARVDFRFVYSDSSFVHDGVTALMWASDAGALSTVRLLLSHGADVRPREFALRGAHPPRLRGHAALELARDPRVAALIRSASRSRRPRGR